MIIAPLRCDGCRNIAPGIKQHRPNRSQERKRSTTTSTSIRPKKIYATHIRLQNKHLEIYLENSQFAQKIYATNSRLQDRHLENSPIKKSQVFLSLYRDKNKIKQVLFIFILFRLLNINII